MCRLHRFHLSFKILKDSKFNLVGVDNLNDYYDVKIKKDRLNLLKKINFNKFYKIDIKNKKIKKKFLKNIIFLM